MIEQLTDKKVLSDIFKNHSVEKAYLFGSVVNGDLRKGSDIDFLIRFKSGIEPVKRGELWWSLYDILRDLFNKEIDLINEASLKNPYFIAEVNKTKKLIYG
ncbi:MAG: nucleotidyltransferase domain-containing protein [Bacteroidetes bacterium]|nr:MAG: nucleotidyltransferase domain-containing protein [Bacteroidota bacterium]